MSLISSLIDVINQNYYLREKNLAQRIYNKNKKMYECLLRKLLAHALNSMSNSVKPFSVLEKKSIYVNIEPTEIYVYIPYVIIFH